jgi:hypothetical protein
MKEEDVKPVEVKPGLLVSHALEAMGDHHLLCTILCGRVLGRSVMLVAKGIAFRSPINWGPAMNLPQFWNDIKFTCGTILGREFNHSQKLLTEKPNQETCCWTQKDIKIQRKKYPQTVY